MNLIQRAIIAGLLGGMAWLMPAAGGAAEPLGIKVLLIDGQNNHNWQATTPVLRAMLEDAGFTVAVATVPAGGPPREDFAPPLAEVDVVLSNFTDFGGPPAPKKLFDRLAEWTAAGGGFVAVHAATAGMGHLPEYRRMVGMGWGAPDDGARLAVAASGEVIRTPRGEGRGTGHGPIGPVDVTLWGDHPIVAGLPRRWQVRDELWFAARGPAERLTVLGTGFAPQTEQHEPVLWTVDYGKGRVFVQLLGHDVAAMREPGFRVTLLRGAEWAATGKVTQPAPPQFP